MFAKTEFTATEVIALIRRSHGRSLKTSADYTRNWQGPFGPMHLQFDNAREIAAEALVQAAQHRRDLIAAKAGRLTEWLGRPVV